MISALKTNRTHTNAWSGKPAESAASPRFPVGEAGSMRNVLECHDLLTEWSRVAGRGIGAIGGAGEVRICQEKRAAWVIPERVF